MKYADAVEANPNQRLKCDMCPEIFSLSEVVLVDPINAITVIAPGCLYLYVDKDGVIWADPHPASKDRGDKLLACPHCNLYHPFGFKPDPSTVVYVGNSLH